MFRRKGADCHPLLGTRILHTFPVRFNRIFHKNSIVLKEKMANTNSKGNNAKVTFDGLPSDEVQNIMKRAIAKRSEKSVKIKMWSSFCGSTRMTISEKKCYDIALLRGFMRRTVLWLKILIWYMCIRMPLTQLKKGRTTARLCWKIWSSTFSRTISPREGIRSKRTSQSKHKAVL